MLGFWMRRTRLLVCALNKRWSMSLRVALLRPPVVVVPVLDGLLLVLLLPVVAVVSQVLLLALLLILRNVSVLILLLPLPL